MISKIRTYRSAPIGIILAFFRREWVRMLDQKVHYVLMVLFLLYCGLLTWLIGGGPLMQNRANLSAFFDLAYHGLFLLLPWLGARMINRERVKGTMEWLLTRPVTVFQIVSGKYLALLAFMVIMLLFTLPWGLTLAFTGDPDQGAVLGGTLGLFLTGAVFAALAMMAGSFTKNIVWTMILAYGINLPFYGVLQELFIPVPGPVLQGISLRSPVQVLSMGVVDLSAPVYMVSLIVVALYITTLTIREINKESRIPVMLRGRKYLLFILVTGCLFGLNVYLRKHALRIDMTEDRHFALSEPTREILATLEDPVRVEVWLSERLPEYFRDHAEQVRTLLGSYRSKAKNRLKVLDKDPAREEALYPFDHLVFRSGSGQEVISLAASSGGLEYQISRAIQRVSRKEKPVLGILHDGGSAGIRDLAAALAPFGKYYEVREIDLQEPVPTEFKVLLFIRPQVPLQPADLQYLDQYLEQGGNLFLAINRVQMDLQTQSGTGLRTGIGSWMENKGIAIEPNFIVDELCGSIAIQKQSGFFRFTSNVSFPYLPRAVNFGDHPITHGLKQIVFSFVSEVRPEGKPGISFVPLILSSGRSNVQEVPLKVDLEKSWSNEDWVDKRFPMAAAVQFSSGSRMVVVGDGDFLVKIFPAEAEPLPGDHILFLSQSVEWLSDPNGLITIKGKEITTPRISPMSRSLKIFLSWFNAFLPVIFTLLLAWSWNRHRRIQAYRRRGDK